MAEISKKDILDALQEFYKNLDPKFEKMDDRFEQTVQINQTNQRN